MLSAEHANEFVAIVERGRRSAPLAYSSIHGEQHWQSVARIGSRLAADTAAADLRLVLLFAALHDACRENENHDPDHGRRAGSLIDQLHGSGELSLDRDELARMRDAVARHNDGEISRDPTIGVCWDADRLCLPRVGIEPRDELLSTLAGRRHRDWARGTLSEPMVDWRELLRSHEQRSAGSGSPRR